MIDLYTGVPGSGKTYKLVYKLRELCLQDSRKYKHIFTNINGLNYDKCNELANDNEFTQSFDFIDLKQHMVQEFNLYEGFKTGSDSTPSEEVIISIDDLAKDEDHIIDDNGDCIVSRPIKDYDTWTKNQNLYAKYRDSLIVIDECHLYFEERADPVLIRFLSYHRHFNIDLILVTQNKNLIDKKYLSFIESMYIALPSSKRLFSHNILGFNLVKFRYRKYASYQEYSSNIVGTESLSFKKDVYSLYNSGGTEITKSASGKFLLPVVVMLIITIIGYKMLSSRFDPAPVPQPVQESRPDMQKLPLVDRESFSNDSQKDFYIVDCFSNNCTFKDTLTSFDKSTMMIFVSKFSCEIIVNQIIDKNFNAYILECDTKLSKLLQNYKSNQGEQRHEKTNTSSLNPFSNN